MVFPEKMLDNHYAKFRMNENFQLYRVKVMIYFKLRSLDIFSVGTPAFHEFVQDIWSSLIIVLAFNDLSDPVLRRGLKPNLLWKLSVSFIRFRPAAKRPVDQLHTRTKGEATVNTVRDSDKWDSGRMIRGKFLYKDSHRAINIGTRIIIVIMVEDILGRWDTIDVIDGILIAVSMENTITGTEAIIVM